MRGAFKMAIHCRQIGTAESGIAYRRHKCSIVGNFPLAISSNIYRMRTIISVAVENDFNDSLSSPLAADASFRSHVSTCCRLVSALDSLDPLVALTSRLLLRGSMLLTLHIGLHNAAG